MRFLTDHDNNPTPIERMGYRAALKAGIPLEPAVGLNALLRAVNNKTIAIVLYNTDSDRGHFSPLLGTSSGKLILPYSEKSEMTKAEFTRRWRAPGILRQCVLVSRAPKIT